MDRIRSLVRPLMIVLLLAAPAVVQRIASEFIDVPYLQPLALTVDDFASTGEVLGEGPWIRVDIDWGSDYEGHLTRAHLRQAIAASLSHQTKRFVLVYHDGPGLAIGISFTVGPNRYGPFSPGAMVSGIDLALAAFGMANDLLP